MTADRPPLSPGDHYDLVIAVRQRLHNMTGDNGYLLLRRFGLDPYHTDGSGPSLGSVERTQHLSNPGNPLTKGAILSNVRGKLAWGFMLTTAARFMYEIDESFAQ